MTASKDATVMLVDGKVVDVKDMSFSFDEVHVWSKADEALAAEIQSVKRTGEVAFDVSFDPSAWDSAPIFPALPGRWHRQGLVTDHKTREDEPLEPEREPVVVAPDGSDCDHPEELREPLPYQGRAADPSEWECGACGAWRLHEPTVAELRQTLLDDIANAYGVPPSVIGGAGAATVSVAGLERAVQEELRKKKAQAEDAMLAEMFGGFPTPAPPKFDARASLVVEAAPRPEPIYYSVDGSVDHRRVREAEVDVVVTGPVDPSMTDDDVVRVIQEMDVLASRTFPTRARRRWVMDNQSWYRINRIAPPSYGALVAHGVNDPRSAVIVGYPLEVDDRAPRYKIKLVCE